jgi:hypothetical protein
VVVAKPQAHLVRIEGQGSIVRPRSQEIIMIRNVFAAAFAVALLGATPALATGPFVASDGNGGLNVIHPTTSPNVLGGAIATVRPGVESGSIEVVTITPSPNVLGGAIATIRPGVESGSIEVVTITPSQAQDPRAVMVEQGFGAGELRLVPLAARPGAPVGG